MVKSRMMMISHGGRIAVIFKKVDFIQALSYINFKASAGGLKSGLSSQKSTAQKIQPFKNDCRRQPGMSAIAELPRIVRIS